MKLTIDTRADSKSDIEKTIGFLKELIGNKHKNLAAEPSSFNMDMPIANPSNTEPKKEELDSGESKVIPY